MKCYSHRGSDAVGVCKYCSRGLCGGCARDFGKGLVCSDACAAQLATKSPAPAAKSLASRMEAFAAPKFALEAKAPPKPKGPSLYARLSNWQIRPFKFLMYFLVAIGLAAVGAMAMS